MWGKHLFSRQEKMSRKRSAWNAKCPIFLGNFTPKTSNYCLKNRALGFPGVWRVVRHFWSRPTGFLANWIFLLGTLPWPENLGTSSLPGLLKIRKAWRLQGSYNQHKEKFYPPSRGKNRPTSSEIIFHGHRMATNKNPWLTSAWLQKLLHYFLLADSYLIN